MTDINVGFGTDLNFKVTMKAARIAIGTGAMTAVEIVITVPAKARAARANVPSTRGTQGSQRPKLKSRTSSLKRRRSNPRTYSREPNSRSLK
jgi:hypothetical protein